MKSHSKALVFFAVSKQIPVVYSADCGRAEIRVCNHVIAVYSENKLQHYATAYRNHKSAGEKCGLFRFLKDQMTKF